MIFNKELFGEYTIDDRTQAERQQVICKNQSSRNTSFNKRSGKVEL